MRAASNYHCLEQPCLQVGVSPLIGIEITTKVQQVVAAWQQNNAADSKGGLRRRQQLQAAKRSCQLLMHEADLDPLLHILQAGALDVIIVPEVAPLTQLRSVKIAQDTLMVVAPGSSGEAITAAELAQQTLVMVPDTCGLTRLTHQLVADCAGAVKVYPGQVSSYSSIEGVVVLAVACLCTALYPEQLQMIVVALILLGFGWCCLNVTGATLFSRCLQETENKAVVQGAADALTSFCAALVAFAAGPILTATSYSILAWGAAALLIPLVFCLVDLRRQACAKCITKSVQNVS